MTEEKTYFQMRNEFQENFFKLIKPNIRDFENERIQNLFISIFLSILFIILAIAIILFTVKIENETIGTFICCIGLFFALLAFNVIPYTKKFFESSLKQKIMPLVCSCFENLEWTSEEYYDDRIFFNANLLVHYPNFTAKYDDMFKGTRKDVCFEIAELFWQRDNNPFIKQREGAIIKIKMNKNFSGNTIIETKQALKRGGIMELLSYDYSNNNCKLNLTKLEDIEFNNKYDIYTDDEVESRYLLTPSFMQKLKTMKIAFKAKKIRCSFYKNHLLIGLFTKKDLFSICSLLKPVDDPKQFFTMYEEIVSVIKLIDHFKLDQKIGL